MDDQVLGLLVVMAVLIGAGLKEAGVLPKWRFSIDDFYAWGMALALIGGLIYLFGG